MEGVKKGRTVFGDCTWLYQEQWREISRMIC